MEMNLGDLGLSPAMLARIQAGGGIMGKPKPKGKKKAVAKKAKPGVKLRRGKPVASVNTPPLNANLVAGTEPTREEQRDIMNGFFGGNAIYPGDPGYEAALAEAGPSSGGLFSGGANLTPEQAERIKAAQAANPGGGFFGKGTNAPKSPTPKINQMQKLKDLFGGADPIKTSQFPTGPDRFPMDMDAIARIKGGIGGSGGIAKAQSVVPSSNALSGPGITGVEADKRAKAYAEANNIEMDGRTPIFTSEAQRDAMYAAGFRGTGSIKLSEEDMASRRAESLANETPSDKAFRESRESVLKEREENPVPTGTLNPDQYRLLKNEDFMDDDDDFFEDTEGRFGEAGTVYSKGFSESVVDDVSAERAQLKRDAIAANLDLGIDEPVGNVRDPNVAPINELFPDAPQAPTPPQLPEVRETYIPRNILGPSYDPKDREAYAAKVQAQRDQMKAGSNIQSGGYPTAMNPMSAMPQTQFGGYGAQMPMQALNPYAGMARRNPAKTDFFPDYIQRPPATGMAPKIQPKITD